MPRPSSRGGGNHVVGPSYPPDPALSDQGKPRGQFFNVTIDMAGLQVYNGSDPTFPAGACHGPTPGECCHKTWNGVPCAVNLDRRVFVYIPHQFNSPPAGASLMVMQDGPGYFYNVAFALDNLGNGSNIATTRTLRQFIVVSIENGGSDAIKSERGLEYDTMSDRYARFVTEIVLPAVLNDTGVKSAFPELAFSANPSDRAAFGCSSGGSAALSMGWFRPDLFGRVAAYSGTFVDQQDHQDKTGARAKYPFGAWEYHSASQLIANTSPPKPLRIFHHCSEQDLGYYTQPAPISSQRPISTNNTDGDDTGNWTDGHHNWRTAGNRTADALAARGYKYRHVYALAAHHCDARVILHTLADTLAWLWRDN